MTRLISAILTAGLLLLWAVAPAAAQDTLNVAVGAFKGRGMNDKQIARFQKQLKRIEGVRIQSTRTFRAAAKRSRQRIDRLPDDARGLATVAAAAETDAVVFAWLESGARRNDKRLRIQVFDGLDGQRLGEREVPVPKGRLTDRIWEASAKAIAGDLYRVLDRKTLPPASASLPPADMTLAPVQLDPRPPPPRRDLHEPAEPRGPRSSIVEVRAGLALLSRDFSWTPAADSPVLAEGLQYASALVPGIAIDLEAYPLEAFLSNAARGLGLGVRYEKVFLSTNQIDEAGEVKALETTHQHLLMRLMYRYAFDTTPTAVQLKAHAGYGLLAFEVEDNADYRGATYGYFDLGLGAYIPLTTPLLALELDLSYLAGVDLGDRTDEIGGEASTAGYRVYGGLASSLSMGVFFSAGVELTGFNSDLKGPGRDGRLGTEASDRFLGMRFMAGYRY